MGGYNINLRNVKNKRLVGSLIGHPFQGMPQLFSQPQVAFSPDGKRIIATTESRQRNSWLVIVFDIAKQEIVRSSIGHKDEVTKIAFSPDGRWFATASQDRSIKLWDAATCEEVAALHGHWQAVNSIAFSPDGNRIVSASDDQTVKVWNLSSILLQAHVHPQLVQPLELVFSSDGRWMFKETAPGRGSVIDGQTMALLSEFGLPDYFYPIGLSDDGGKLVGIESAELSSTLRVFDCSDGAMRAGRNFDDQNVTVRNITYHARTARLAIPYSNAIAILDANSLDEVCTIELPRASNQMTLRFSPDGARLLGIASSADFGLRQWDPTTGQELDRIFPRLQCRDFVFSPDGKQIAVASDRQIRLLDATTGKVTRTYPGYFRISPYSGLVFSPDGLRLIVGHSILVASTGEELWRAKQLSRSSFQPKQFADGGQLLFAAPLEYPVLAPRVDEVRTIAGHTSPIRCAVFSPDGSLIVSGDEGGVIRLRQTSNLQLVHLINAHQYQVDAVAISPNNQWLATGGPEALKVWDVSTGKLSFSIPTDSGSGMRIIFHPDGNLVLAENRKRVFLVDLGEQKVVHELMVAANREWLSLATVNFSADGGQVFAIDSQGKTSLWDTASGRSVNPSEANPPQRHFRSTPDGQSLITFSDNTLLKIDLQFKNRPVEKHFREFYSTFQVPDNK